MNILVLSPHRDDAAFSLALAIHHWLTLRHKVTLLNVFTRSRYAPFSDAAFVHENDELSYVSAMRLREDQLFIRRMQEPLAKGLKPHLQMAEVNLKDAPIRLRIPVDQVSTVAADPADRAIEKIRRSLARLADEGAVDALAIPAGIGRHVDHLVARDAAQPFTANRPIAYYEELPYAVTHSTAEEDRIFIHALDRSLTLLTYPPNATAEASVARKRRLILNYASQIEETDANTIANAQERIWVNARWINTVDAN